MNTFQNPFFNPYLQQPVIQPPIQPVQVVRVNGENGAKSYQIGANSSALLLDESGLLVWLVTSDGAGYKTVSAYDITPHQAAPQPDYGTLENRIARLEEIVNASTDSSATGRKSKSDDGYDQTGKNSYRRNEQPRSGINADG